MFEQDMGERKTIPDSRIPLANSFGPLNPYRSAMADSTARITPAIASGQKLSFVLLPANALVTLVAGDPNGNGFVKVLYRDKILSMSAVDLRSHGERVREHSS
jgi:hypothetical protein